MSDQGPWTVSYRRLGFRYLVWRLKHSNFLGAVFTNYAENGKVQRFWRKKNAQTVADKLNQREAGR